MNSVSIETKTVQNFADHRLSIGPSVCTVVMGVALIALALYTLSVKGEMQLSGSDFQVVLITSAVSGFLIALFEGIQNFLSHQHMHGNDAENRALREKLSLRNQELAQKLLMIRTLEDRITELERNAQGDSQTIQELRNTITTLKQQCTNHPATNDKITQKSKNEEDEEPEDPCLSNSSGSPSSSYVFIKV